MVAADLHRARKELNNRKGISPSGVEEIILEKGAFNFPLSASGSSGLTAEID
jgi:hypothetical protein